MSAPRRKSRSPASSPGNGDKNVARRPDEMPADVLEFITAIERYKRTRQRPFPSWSEVLDVLKALGYVRTGSSLPQPAGTQRRKSA